MINGIKPFCITLLYRIKNNNNAFILQGKIDATSDCKGSLLMKSSNAIRSEFIKKEMSAIKIRRNNNAQYYTWSKWVDLIHFIIIVILPLVYFITCTLPGGVYLHWITVRLLSKTYTRDDILGIRQLLINLLLNIVQAISDWGLSLSSV